MGALVDMGESTQENFESSLYVCSNLNNSEQITFAPLDERKTKLVYSFGFWGFLAYTLMFLQAKNSRVLSFIARWKEMKVESFARCMAARIHLECCFT